MDKAKNNQVHFSKKEAIVFGFQTAKKNVVFFLGVFVIWAVITILSSSVQNSLNANKQVLIGLGFNILMWVVNSVISLGFVNISLKFVEGKKTEYKDIYYTTKLFSYILASFIRTLIVIFGFLLFIVPGIIFSIKLQFLEYLIVDKKMEAVDAIKGSWEMTKGIKWNLFLFGLLLGLINILGLLCFLVGLMITMPLSMIATAFIYRKLISQTSLKQALI